MTAAPSRIDAPAAFAGSTATRVDAPLSIAGEGVTTVAVAAGVSNVAGRVIAGRIQGMRHSAGHS